MTIIVGTEQIALDLATHQAGLAPPPPAFPGLGCKPREFQARCRHAFRARYGGAAPQSGPAAGPPARSAALVAYLIPKNFLNDSPQLVVDPAGGLAAPGSVTSARVRA